MAWPSAPRASNVRSVGVIVGDAAIAKRFREVFDEDWAETDSGKREEKEAKEAKKQKKREEDKKEDKKNVGTGVRVGVSILGGILGPKRSKP